MDITVYLPDEIGQRGKDAKVNMSGLLRSALEEELSRREAVSEALADDQVQTFEVQLSDEEGRAEIGRITGVILDEDDRYTVYLTDDERVLVYDSRKESYYTTTADDLAPDEFPEALRALGVTPVRDI